MLDVITIGASTRDVFVVSKAFKMIRSNKFDTGVGECVSFGSKIELDDLVLTTGGGATNAAATFGSLGLKTATITRIGDDTTGADILHDLKAHKVKTDLVKTVKGGRSGFSVLLTANNGERSVLVQRGVSGEFDPKDVPLTKLKTKWIYITSLAGNIDAVKRVAQYAAKKNIQVAYNPGSQEIKKGVKAFADIIPHLALLNVNLEEAQLLARTKSKDIKFIAEKIRHEGLTLIITDGPRGAYACTEEGILFSRTRSVKVISRTGAGDAFGSGTVAALMHGFTLEDALRVGTLNAESVIQSYGAKQGILTKWPSQKELNLIKIRNVRTYGDQ